MRASLRVGGAVLALVLAACSGTNEPADETFLQDLELASAATPISLQNSGNAAQVVSAIERTSPPATKRAAPSRRVAKYKPAPRAAQAPVETVEDAEMGEELAPEPILVSEAPAEVASLPSQRPQPVYSPGVGVDGDGAGNGRSDVIGSVIGVVIRGGHAGIDNCDPRADRRRRRGGMAINNRIPVIGTFPAGRIQGTFPGSGRMTASLPRAGRSRF